MEANYLEAWDGLKSAIEQAHSVIDLRKIRDQAEAYRYALKVAGESREVVRKAEEIKLRAERRAGEILLKSPKQRPGSYQQKQRSIADTVDIPPSYKDLGITKMDAMKWQRVASIPAKEFERWLKTSDEVSSAGALRLEATLRFAEREAPPLPAGKYGVILADPPWAYEYSHKSFKRVDDHYPTMSLEEICDMGTDIRSLAGKNCTLFLWIPSPHLDKFPAVLDAWGFRYCTTWVWNKQGYSYGHYGSIDHELLIIGGKGKATPTCDLRTTAKVSSVQSIEKTGHSAKPVEYYSLIERFYPDRKYLELFSRNAEPRKRWSYWGDEA
jgi:N6-adenosine-specific RNA methylase IME4